MNPKFSLLSATLVLSALMLFSSGCGKDSSAPTPAPTQATAASEPSDSPAASPVLSSAAACGEVLATHRLPIQSLVQDQNFIYFEDGVSIHRVSKKTGETKTIFTAKEGDSILSMAVDEDFFYWVDSSALYRAYKDSRSVILEMARLPSPDFSLDWKIAVGDEIIALESNQGIYSVSKSAEAENGNDYLKKLVSLDHLSAAFGISHGSIYSDSDDGEERLVMTDAATRATRSFPSGEARSLVIQGGTLYFFGKGKAASQNGLFSANSKTGKITRISSQVGEGLAADSVALYAIYQAENKGTLLRYPRMGPSSMGTPQRLADCEGLVFTGEVLVDSEYVYAVGGDFFLLKFPK
jgi:hypothetical protein